MYPIKYTTRLIISVALIVALVVPQLAPLLLLM